MSPGINAGILPSIAVDLADDPIIPYNDQTGLDLMCATRPPGSWTIQTVDAQGNTGYWPSIAVDATNRPLIAYDADIGLGTRFATGSAIAGVNPTRVPAAFAGRVRGPNPCAGDRPMKVEVSSPVATGVSLSLLDIGGRVVASRPLQQVGPGTTTFELDLGPRKPGVYSLRALALTGWSAAERVAIVR